MREKRRYKIINVATGKIVKHIGKLQYFRTKAFAKMEKMKLEKELVIKLKVVKQEWKKEKLQEGLLPQE